MDKEKKEKIMTFFLYRKVKKYVEMEETVSTKKLQHKFNIGYAKASEMMDRLEADGKIKLKIRIIIKISLWRKKFFREGARGTFA